uniref:Alpha/beta hydrolase fold-3 domain-containing protein n=1 Tax=Salix viminalis TaxID=40686 RepID=A0A6N2L8J8_SALVM
MSASQSSGRSHRFVENPDGSLTRNSPFPEVPPSEQIAPGSDQTSLSKDIPLNPTNKTFLRLFRPLNPHQNSKLPLIIYFHGGGFVLYSAATLVFHQTCCDMASHLPLSSCLLSIVSLLNTAFLLHMKMPWSPSGGSRNRLWASTALLANPGSRNTLIFQGRCNIAYHASLHALNIDIKPLRIIGLILNALISPASPGLNRRKGWSTILFCHWLLVIRCGPGTDRDHGYCNPIVGAGAFQKNEIERLPRCFFRGYHGDPLVDKQKEVVKMLESRGVDVVAKFDEDGFHAVEVFDPSKAKALYDYFEDLSNFVENPDGSLTRNSPFPEVPPSEQIAPGSDQTTLSKDIPLNAANKTFLRLFRPLNPPQNSKLPSSSTSSKDIPLSAATLVFHQTCCDMASHLPALILSVEYRLAPEHRLPAAYEDAMESIRWVQKQALASTALLASPGLRNTLIFEVFLDGNERRGNIAYHANLHALNIDIKPLRIIDVGPVSAEGTDRDHGYCNPIAGAGAFEKNEIERLPRCFVRGYHGDPLVDKQKEVVKMLESRGVDVVAKFDEDGFHAISSILWRIQMARSLETALFLKCHHQNK